MGRDRFRPEPAASKGIEAPATLPRLRHTQMANTLFDEAVRNPSGSDAEDHAPHIVSPRKRGMIIG